MGINACSPSVLIPQTIATQNQQIIAPTEQLGLAEVSPFIQTGGVFLYHPLTEIDSSSFDQEFQLDEGAYDFIDGEIKKKKRS